VTSPAHKRLPGLTRSTGLIDHPFDLAFGVRTSGLVAGRDLQSGHTHDRHATAYYGVAPSVFERLLERWRRTRPAASIEDTTFLDIGAGMGRAVLLAAEMPFRRVIGVESQPALVRIARRNLTAWRKAGRSVAPMRIAEADVVEFDWPIGPAVVFLFNPFGAVVMRRFVRALARAYRDRAGQLDVLYVNNEQDWVFEQQRGFTRLFSGKVRRSPADTAADRHILTSQPDGEYAWAPHEDCSIWRWTGHAR
jgi:predicted RNA methylase